MESQTYLSPGRDAGRSSLLTPFPFGECHVCNDKATGIHYGAPTCEGCKGFYKRSLEKFTTYKCHNMGLCNTALRGRNRCKACRFKRCVAAGMSMNAIRMGRIPKLERVRAFERFADGGKEKNLQPGVLECDYQYHPYGMLGRPGLMEFHPQQQAQHHRMEAEKAALTFNFVAGMVPVGGTVSPPSSYMSADSVALGGENSPSGTNEHVHKSHPIMNPQDHHHHANDLNQTQHPRGQHYLPSTRGESAFFPVIASHHLPSNNTFGLSEVAATSATSEQSAHQRAEVNSHKSTMGESEYSQRVGFLLKQLLYNLPLDRDLEGLVQHLAQFIAKNQAKALPQQYKVLCGIATESAQSPGQHNKPIEEPVSPVSSASSSYGGSTTSSNDHSAECVENEEQKLLCALMEFTLSSEALLHDPLQCRSIEQLCELMTPSRPASAFSTTSTFTPCGAFPMDSQTRSGPFSTDMCTFRYLETLNVVHRVLVGERLSNHSNWQTYWRAQKQWHTKKQSNVTTVASFAAWDTSMFTEEFTLSEGFHRAVLSEFSITVLKLSCFLLQIPGFRKLPKTVQVEVCYNAVYDFFFLSNFHLWHIGEYQGLLASNQQNSTTDIHDLKHFFSASAREQALRAKSTIHRLGFNDAELSVWMAYRMTKPAHLHNGSPTDVEQLTKLNAFYKWLLFRYIQLADDSAGPECGTKCASLPLLDTQLDELSLQIKTDCNSL